jgi:hypothetical protein
VHKLDLALNRAIRARDRLCTRGDSPSESVVELSAPSEITRITGKRCAGRRQMLPTAVSSAGSCGGMPTWTFTGGGASTGTAARGGGSKAERVPRTGWRFVRHLNRLSALAFLRPVRKVSLGAEFPVPFREPILRPGFPTPLPRAGRAQKYRTRRAALGDSDSWRSERARIFVLGPRPGGEVLMPVRRGRCVSRFATVTDLRVPDIRFRLDASPFAGRGSAAERLCSAIDC